MSAVHDWATVTSEYPTNRETVLQPGDRVEVVGYVVRGGTLFVIWRDEAGLIDDIPAASVRLEPWVEDRIAFNQPTPTGV